MWMLSNLFFQSSLEKVSIKGTNYPDNPNLALQQVELESIRTELAPCLIFFRLKWKLTVFIINSMDGNSVIFARELLLTVF